MKKVLAYEGVVQAIAAMSKDRSTKVGALILGPGLEIRSTGRNGFARGVNDDVEARHERPEKYFWTAHAEENAITQAARSGASTEGCSIVVKGLSPCSTCARMIINAGIKHVFVLPPDDPDAVKRWSEDTNRALTMLAEGGVEVHPI